MSIAGSSRVQEYLRHILEAIQRVDRYVDELSELDFLVDEKTQDAVIRNFEIRDHWRSMQQRYKTPRRLRRSAP